MCGIVGVWGGVTANKAMPVEDFQRAVDVLKHRGPDASGVWEDRSAGVLLGHRRLSIVDLSPKGAQPMTSLDGRYVISYNGEIYNFRELRSELEFDGHVFRSDTDTEVLLEGIARWGVEGTVEKCIGMFAFGLWDRKLRRLYLVRDRLGIKPLYFGLVGNRLAFASELKALKALPGFSNAIDRDALTLFFRHNYIPAPYSIYDQIEKLTPGTIAIFDSPDHKCELREYWSADAVWRNGINSPLSGDEREVEMELERLLSDAVGRRMLADVPVGAFLSGGIDSSTVVALMQKQSSKNVRTFSIGFREQEFNEAGYAKDVAKHLGTDHTELILEQKEMLSAIPDLPCIWDEPFSDSSQLPTFFVSQMAKEHVTVCLSGDGGDELFWGYDRYSYAEKYWKMLSKVPLPLRRGVLVGKPFLRTLCGALGSFGQKASWRLDALASADFVEFYRFLVSHHKKPAQFVLGGKELPTAYDRVLAQWESNYSLMSLLDVNSYLPDDILTKVDRASMAVSLEARVPLLDHRVVEFSARLPESMKRNGVTGKQVLRNILHRYVPKELVERPKKGFGIPLEQWLRGELRDWAESLLDYNLIKRQGLLDSDYVRMLWSDFLKGSSYRQFYLWDVLMFQAWFQKNML